MARLFPVGDYPPTHQELVILRILKSRPHHGWTLDELLDELSKGRAKPMSYSALAVHMTHLRRKGYAVKRQVVYSVGSLEPPGSSDGMGSVHKVRQHHVDCPGGGARADRIRRR
jgi:hypothetical protein